MNEGEVGNGLILWDPEIVADWLARNESYVRLRERANSGSPALSAQTYGEVLRTLRRRRLTEAQVKGYVEEIKEHLQIVDLTADRAEAYALAVLDCARLAQYPTQTETWFAWQVALHRREGHRIMTKAPQRYRGLVGPDHLA